jgi:adenylate kinase
MHVAKSFKYEFRVIRIIMNLIFLGAPGVGKGTHAEIVSKEFSIPKISTGDILREEVKKQTELGMKAKGYMDRGELVPDDLVIKILEKRLKEKDCEKGFILDGFPRTLPQAKALERFASIDLVLNFKASKETIIERITGRYTCRKCGAIYHVKNMPPKVEGVCDVCGGELYQREDQKREVVENRLKVYEKLTKPLIDYYRKKGVIRDIDVEGSIETVSKRVLEVLKNN